MSDHPRVETIYESEQETEQRITALYGTVDIGGIEYSAGYVIRNVDTPRFDQFCGDDDAMSFQCTACESQTAVYDTEQEAIDCCDYLDCEECGESHETEEEADLCCEQETAG